MVVVFCLARDGCLVRSWFGVAQRGVGAARRGALGVDMRNKRNRTTATRGLVLIETRVKS